MNLMKKTAVLYHYPCPDGAFAALAAHLYFSATSLPAIFFPNTVYNPIRSLFVPYFKYMLEDCVHHLTDFEDVKSFGSSRKKKKAKIVEAGTNKEESTVLPTLKWHLRALVISSLHKCFLYDNGSLKFLDSSNFQVLLKPIISQLSVDPPTSIEERSDLPSVNEVDDLLVGCVGQMAFTAGSDLLWKPLNHEGINA